MNIEELNNKILNIEKKYSKKQDKVNEYCEELENTFYEYADLNGNMDYEFEEVFKDIVCGEDCIGLVLGASVDSLYYWYRKDGKTCVDEIDYDKIEEMGYPVFVKPTNGGSSVATFKVKEKSEIRAAVEEGLKWDCEVMIEEFVEGEEITCPVFDGEMWPVIAIKPHSDFFDYTQKYAANGADEIVVELEENLHKEVEKMALDTYKGVPYILEVNTLPGMTPASLFPKSAAAKNISYSELLDKIIETSILVRSLF